MKFPFSLLLMFLAAPVWAQSGTNAQLDAALAAYDNGALDSAMTLVNAAIAAEPTLAKAYKLRGDIHQKRLEFEPALADYARSEDIDPLDPRLYVSRSALRITDENYKGGLRDADKALDIDPMDADGWYNRACALYLQGDGDAALKSARKAMELRPSFAEALYLSGVIKGEYDEEEGLEEINAALKMQPNIPGGMMSVAVLLFESKQYKEAIEKFTEVIATDTTELAAAFYYRADSYYNLDDKAHACADWQRSARLGDTDAAIVVKTYCETDAKVIPKRPRKGRRKTSIQF